MAGPRSRGHVTRLLAGLGLLLLIFNAWYFLVVLSVTPGQAWKRIWEGPTDHILDDPRWRASMEEYASLNRLHQGRRAIVFLGDSITRDFPVEELFPTDPGDSVVVLNRGIYSDTVLGLEARFAQNVTNLSVEKLFLLIGTNDLRVRSTEETAARVEALLRSLPADRVFVQSILPVPAARKRAHRGAREYNQKLEAMCRRHGYTYIDLYSHFSDEKGEMKTTLGADGVHPNGRGHELWKSLITPFLES